MQSIRLDIPHVQQPEKSAMCGAACLEMVYAHFGNPMSQHDIWPEICKYEPVTKRENCHTYLMGLHAQKRGLNAIAISCEKPLELVECCLAEKIVPIILCRTDLVSQYGHYCVVTGISYKGITINDPMGPPQKGYNRLLKIKEFIPSLRPKGEITTGQTMLLIASQDVSTVSVVLQHVIPSRNSPNTICKKNFVIFRAIQPFNPRILCLQHDSWFSAS